MKKIISIIILIFYIISINGCNYGPDKRVDENPYFIEDIIEENNISQVYNIKYSNRLILEALSDFYSTEITTKYHDCEYHIVYGQLDNKDIFLTIPDFVEEEIYLFDSPYPSYQTITHFINEYNVDSEYKITTSDKYKGLFYGFFYEYNSQGDTNISLISDNISSLDSLYRISETQLTLILGNYQKDNINYGIVSIVLLKDKTYSVIVANDGQYFEIHHFVKD